jgi:hypothetical protein
MNTIFVSIYAIFMLFAILLCLSLTTSIVTMTQSARPSLYSGTASSDNAEIFSILGALEPARPSRHIGKWVALLVLTLLVCGGALAAFTKLPYLHSPAAADSVRAPQHADAQGPAIPASSVPAAPVSASPAVPPSVARIVTDEPIEQPARAEAELIAKANTEASAVDHVSAVAARRPAGSEEKPIPSTVNAPVAVQKPRPGHAARAPAPRHDRKKDVKRRDDRDVDLIAALLTRASGTTGTEKSAATAKASKTSAARGMQNASATTVATDKPKRDLVVVRQTGETMTSVIHRCRALGLIEGELCRLRVCADKWGKDAACPSSGVAPAN